MSDNVTVCLGSSLNQYASNGRQSAGPSRRHQVHSAVRDGFLPGVQRDADTADDWPCR